MPGSEGGGGGGTGSNLAASRFLSSACKLQMCRDAEMELRLNLLQQPQGWDRAPMERQESGPLVGPGRKAASGYS